jgi:hypothetical protein
VHVTMIGNVVEVNRHIKGGKLSTVKLAIDNAGQTIEDDKYGPRETGWFTVQVFEDNLMSESNKDFSGIMGSLKKGSTIVVEASVILRSTKKEGKYVGRAEAVWTALKLAYVNTARRADEDTSTVQKATAAGSEDFQDVPTDDEASYHADSFDD